MARRAKATEPELLSGNRFLTFSEVAMELRVSDRTVIRMISKKELRAIKLGHKTFVKAEDLKQFIKNLPEADINAS